jgi:hypothetical protein
MIARFHALLGLDTLLGFIYPPPMSLANAKDFGLLKRNESSFITLAIALDPHYRSQSKISSIALNIEFHRCP